MASTPINKPTLINNIWSSGGNNIQPDLTKIQTGWVAEIPPYQYFNWLWNRDSQAIAHINQMGVPVWDSLTQYIGGKSWCQGVSGTVYRAVQDSTGQNPDTDTSFTYWQIVDATTSGLNSRYLQRSNNLSDVNNPAQALINLGAAPKANPTFTGTVTLPNISQYDSSQSAVYSAWVKAFGSGWSNVTIIATAPSPTWGAGYVLNSASALTVTMPAPAVGTSGRAITILNFGAGTATLNFPSTVQALGGTTVALNQGDSIEISNDGTNIIAVGGSVQLATSSLIRGMKTDITNLQNTSGNSVQKTGDTMTGDLIIKSNSPIINLQATTNAGSTLYFNVPGTSGDTGKRWAIYTWGAPAGGNTGQQLGIAYSDDTGTLVSTILTASRVDGRVNFPQGVNNLSTWGNTSLNGNVSISGAFNANSGYISSNAPTNFEAGVLVNSGNGQGRYLALLQDSFTRWRVGSGNAENGSDGFGSDFFVSRFHNNGNFWDTPIYISRATGKVTINGTEVVGGVKLGAEGVYNYNNNGQRAPAGCVLTGCYMERFMSFRPIQINIYGVWYTIGQD